jgi:hypothetical protein
MFEHERSRLRVAGRVQALLDGLLHVSVDFQRDVMKRRLRHLRAEQLLVRLVRKLEERERAAVTEPEEQVAIRALRAEQHVGLAPRRHERQADDVLIELARLFEVLRDVGGVMQTRRQFASGSHDSCSSTRNDRRDRRPSVAAAP